MSQTLIIDEQPELTQWTGNESRKKLKAIHQIITMELQDNQIETDVNSPNR